MERGRKSEARPPAKAAADPSRMAPAPVRGARSLSKAQPLGNFDLERSPRVTQQRQEFAAILGSVGQRKSQGPIADAPPVQRKILVDHKEYSPTKEDDPAVADAARDEFLRDYKTKEEMSAHLVAKTPSSFGLIKKRALWYDLPYLSKEFFVLGESHAGVRGSDIKEASNIDKPILYEAFVGWSVSEMQKRKDETSAPTKDMGLEENSSKLLRALEVWNPQDLLAPPSPRTAPEQIPEIPFGEYSTRDTERGTRRLVVRDESGKAAWWSSKEKAAAQTNTYDANKEALDAILDLLKRVFPDRNARRLAKYHKKFAEAWDILSEESWKKEPEQQRLVILLNVSDFLREGTTIRVQEEYEWLHQAIKPADLKAPNDPALKSADDYRNENIFFSLLRAHASGGYSFAAMGEQHLVALKKRLSAKKIPYITEDDFYNRYSVDAVTISRKPPAELPRDLNLANVRELNLGNVITNQTEVIVEAVESGRLSQLKVLRINARSMTPPLRGRLLSCGVEVILT